MEDFFLRVSIENTRFAHGLAIKAGHAEVDADLKIAKDNVLSVIDCARNVRAGIGVMNNRKSGTAELHQSAIAELLAEGVIVELRNSSHGSVTYSRA
ncbi:hypothetical protein [Corynebacterium ulcerans]|uniref:hypothetical protein n=1 Tax=Corynebacterium ulcerans TaxID=65058 RepID=UPI00051F6BF5|nr:hypothetical protein [Corynebacterium ulcerans]AIT89307.1 Hypothetical protein Cul210932_1361 [Corynebacterium ulcerans]ALD95082.1 Hypothetical protein Cul131001_1378 [Corynebacterium ulcerans]SQG58929.1 Uncharacterised protein [Corynebacterium ulcerans]